MSPAQLSLGKIKRCHLPSDMHTQQFHTFKCYPGTLYHSKSLENLTDTKAWGGCLPVLGTVASWNVRVLVLGYT